MNQILIVEDDGIIALDLKRALGELGYGIAGAVSSVDAALELLRTTSPTLALVDIKLRGPRDGVDLAQQLKRDHDLPVVFLTSHSDPATLRRAAAASPLGYVLKPFTTRELEAALAVALERYRLERIILEHERWMAATLQGLPDAVISCDADARVMLLNPAAERLLSTTLEQARGKPLDLLLAAKPGPAPWTHGCTSTRWTGQVRATRLSALEVDAEVLVSCVTGPGRSLVGRVVVVRDVTEKNRTDRRLAQAERLVTLGTLAAGVAHEINNPLSYVLGNVTWAVAELNQLQREGHASKVAQTLKDVAQVLEECFDGTRRISDIVSQLRVLARPGGATSAPVVAVNLSQAIGVAGRLARNVVHHRATLTIDVPCDLVVLANETHLVQVFTNLLANAAQAMPEQVEKRRDIVVTARRATQTAIITVADTGVGMDADQLAQVFDPFFTTKGPNEGMGLGMSICHRHVTEMGGTIDITSRRGEGTTVRVALSLSARGEATIAAAPALTSRRGRVLLIDDDALVADSLARLLARHHEVVTLNDPVAALERLSRDHQWDVVLCDIMMPGLDGAQFYERAKQLAPAIEASFAFVSGGTFTPLTMALLETTQRPVFAKPVPLDEVEAFIARRVAQRPGVVLVAS